MVLGIAMIAGRNPRIRHDAGRREVNSREREGRFVMILVLCLSNRLVEQEALFQSIAFGLPLASPHSYIRAADLQQFFAARTTTSVSKRRRKLGWIARIKLDPGRSLVQQNQWATLRSCASSFSSPHLLLLSWWNRDWLQPSSTFIYKDYPSFALPKLDIKVVAILSCLTLDSIKASLSLVPLI